MGRKLVIANWKMNADKSAVARLLADYKMQIRTTAAVAVCPPAPYLQQAQELLLDSDITLGAQNVSQYAKGAYTGEISATMLAEFGCQYVITGHSERRALFAESDQTVAEKFVAVQQAGLRPVLCVGETREQRQAGQTEAVVTAQLEAVIHSAGIEAFASAVVAYEPVWAIGTGETATPEQAQQVHRLIRNRLASLDGDMALKLPLLYGGSVNADNASALFAMQDIDGGLVGGASLDGAAFAAICSAATG